MEYVVGDNKVGGIVRMLDRSKAIAEAKAWRDSARQYGDGSEHDLIFNVWEVENDRSIDTDPIASFYVTD